MIIKIFNYQFHETVFLGIPYHTGFTAKNNGKNLKFRAVNNQIIIQILLFLNKIEKYLQKNLKKKLMFVVNDI